MTDFKKKQIQTIKQQLFDRQKELRDLTERKWNLVAEHMRGFVQVPMRESELKSINEEVEFIVREIEDIEWEKKQLIKLYFNEGR